MHQIYTAEQFTILYKAMKIYVITCKIKCEALQQYVSDILNGTDADKVSTAKAVNWDTTLPEDIQTEVNSQVSVASQLINQ
jgi:hypothetical protein